MFGYLWQRFMWLGLLGKTVAIILTLYGAGWVLGKLGADSAATSLGSTAILILSVLITGLVIRWLWQNAGSSRPPPR